MRPSGRGAGRGAPQPERMISSGITVIVEERAWRDSVTGASALVRRAVRAARAQAPGARGSIAVLLAGDARLAELNLRHRGKTGPTNVLAFPAPGEDHLGDIAIAYGKCAGEAAAQGKPLAHHLVHLAVHGTLHLLGFDHEAARDARAMEDAERRILARFGIPDPYAARGAEAA